MFMNKPAHQGTWLPWHQDRWRSLDRDPLITLWTPLDPATIANGCIQVIVGSHKLGVINPLDPSAFLTEEQARQHAPADKIVHLEMAAGEVVLLHNWLLHASDVNHTGIPRRRPTSRMRCCLARVRLIPPACDWRESCRPRLSHRRRF